MAIVADDFELIAAQRERRARARAARMRSVQLRTLFIIVATFASAYAALSSNPILSIVSLAVLMILLLLLWMPNQPPVFLFSLGYQWLQVTMVIWQANVAGVEVGRLDRMLPLETTVWYSLIGLVAVAGGIRLALFRMGDRIAARAIEVAASIDIYKLLTLHIVLSIFSVGLWTTVGTGALFQVAFAIDQLKMATLFAVGYVSLTQKRRIGLFVGVFLFEFFFSLGSFFSNFRFPIIVAFLALIAAPGRPGFGRVLGLIVLVVSGVFAAATWSAIKDQFRGYASTGGHAVSIEAGQARALVFDLVDEMRTDDLSFGFNQLANRVRYVDFFAYTVQHVPAAVEHENGALFGTAVMHVLTPRILFPDKPPLVDDTELTRKYTGLNLYAAQDTSISIGYFGDAYIDFGWPGMYVVLLVVGLMLGAVYRIVLQLRNVNPVLAFGAASSIFLNTALFEITLIKLIGGVLTNLIVVYVIGVFALPAASRLIGRRWTLAKPTDAAAQ
jgi:hypothetical protein